MAFSKTFPKSSDKSVYPKWEEIFLTDEEEKKAELECRNDNILKMMQCIDDARSIVRDKKLLESQQILIEVATSLFDKRASHEIFFKERKTKEKFDLINKD
ncbi:hypothetical protein K9L67_05065 [Candidatus Woesearchaeota archaeon]|nr:hypothetical protein [Candidatus Woesearchaeota archaeon]MCF7901568.1 hypothetical protein [Candidatus Woesearchaeota archaeon]MCF8013975.1 hypothetical protein [Candidatus Woesearchaeota archaeon]